MTSKSQGLERNAIGLTEVLFQSITFMAPAVAVALSIGFATTFALGLTPLAVLFALIAVLFTAFSMGELARHLPSAGGHVHVRRPRPRVATPAGCSRGRSCSPRSSSRRSCSPRSASSARTCITQLTGSDATSTCGSR